MSFSLPILSWTIVLDKRELTGREIVHSHDFWVVHSCNACVTMVVTYNTGLAHTYPDSLEKGDFFLRRLDRIPFMAYAVWCMTSSYSKVTSVFVLPLEKNIKASVFEKLLSGDRFRKPAFLVPENVIYVWTEVCGVNCLCFKNIWIRVNGT